MVLSGFLMVLAWRGDFVNDKVLSRLTFNFYINRFFRIAPLYFLLLVICYFVLTPLGTMHDLIAKTYPPPWVADLENYNPTTSWAFDNLRWLVLHLTFMFGALPGGETTPLPDWSLSLEMQFYLVLPIILLILRRLPVWLIAAAFAAVAFLTPILLGNYLDEGLWAHFGQPSALPYRLNAFLAGMIPALWLRLSDDNPWGQSSIFILAISAVLCVLPLSKPVILLYGCFLLIVFRRVWLLSWFLNSKPMRLLGDMSYSIYLCHLLVVTPIVYALIGREAFSALNPWGRYAMAFSIVTPSMLIFSATLYYLIERPGIRFGRHVIQSNNRGRLST